MPNNEAISDDFKFIFNRAIRRKSFAVRFSELALTFSKNIPCTCGFVEQLGELDTKDVEPLAHGVEVRNVFRPDARGVSLPREDALANAPKRNAESFLVPAVLE